MPVLDQRVLLQHLSETLRVTGLVSRAYHLARVKMWAQNRSLHGYRPAGICHVSRAVGDASDVGST